MSLFTFGVKEVRGETRRTLTIMNRWELITFAVKTPETVTGTSGQDLHRGVLNIDFNAALQHPAGADTFERMRTSDTQVRKQLRGVIYPILAADWKIELPKGMEESKPHQEAKEFLEAAVLGIGPQNQWYPDFTFRQHMREALTMLPFGFSTFETAWKGVDGKMIIDRLPLRHAASIVRVETGKNGKLLGLYQKRVMSADDDKPARKIGQSSTRKGQHGTDIYLPVEILIHYTFEQEGINYFGVPMLRAMYKAWKFKEMLERYDVIDSQRRAAGMPLGTLAENDGVTEKDNLVQVVQDMDGSNPESRWAVLTAGQELGYVNNDAKVKDIKDAIARFDKAIADGASGRFMDGGEAGGGLKAVVGKLSDQFFVTLNAIADELTETINRQWISRLIEQNFPTLEGIPKLTFSRLALDEGLALVDTLGVAKQAGLIEHWGLADENHVRSHLRLRPMTKEEAEEIEKKAEEKMQAEAEAAAKAAPDPGSMPGRPGGGNVRVSRDPRASQRGRGDRADRGRADRQKARRATMIEKGEFWLTAHALPPEVSTDEFFDIILSMPLKQQHLKQFEADYSGAITAVVNDIRKDFVARIRKADIHIGNVSKTKARFAGRLQESLKRIGDRVFKFGQERVKIELETMRNLNIKGTHALPKARDKFFSIASEAANAGFGIDVGKVLRREEEVIMSLVAEFAGRGLTGDALADALEASYSTRADTYIVDLGRRGTARSYNAGRDNVAMSGRIAEQAVRNEEMDSRTCADCADLHGLTVVVGSTEYYDFMPPNYCQGHDRCRGEYTYFPAPA